MWRYTFGSGGTGPGRPRDDSKDAKAQGSQGRVADHPEEAVGKGLAEVGVGEDDRLGEGSGA